MTRKVAFDPGIDDRSVACVILNALNWGSARLRSRQWHAEFKDVWDESRLDFDISDAEVAREIVALERERLLSQP